MQKAGQSGLAAAAQDAQRLPPGRNHVARPRPLLENICAEFPFVAEGDALTVGQLSDFALAGALQRPVARSMRLLQPSAAQAKHGVVQVLPQQILQGRVQPDTSGKRDQIVTVAHGLGGRQRHAASQRALGRVVAAHS
ncbi:MAG: hypothetical protein B7Y08_18385 [Rhodospirillales bacterium 24-66-33]|nr:MAG: hypothetical protein B7Y57_17140 [Rhodospirillales bacterium 35-66-84]OYZ93052.1 MAG: hypothetical protein B7Y08_18385 [Rhodospirillales bacterium 24-66-33]OZB24181.1 MAG: hypothetical protein B7X63_16350 [Rhodospirillales bacterium 39-66-50]